MLNICVCVRVQVFLCRMCGSVSGSRLSSSSHQRRPLELLHVRTPEHLWVTAATGRLAQQTSAFLCQQPRAGICKSDSRHVSIHYNVLTAFIKRQRQEGLYVYYEYILLSRPDFCQRPKTHYPFIIP